MSLIHKALWVIERNLDHPHTLNDLAEACGVSRTHLAHAFGRAIGMPVMQYLRGRRLSIAAQMLACGAPDILDLALASGYGSHEAFSRAFRAQFGVTPEMVRRQATTENLPMIKLMNMKGAAGTRLKQPRFVNGNVILAVGLARRHEFGKPQDIPAQWQAFMKRYAEIPDRRPEAPIGIGDEIYDDGNFEYICAAEVSAFSGTPRGLIEMTIAPQRYAVFRHDGHVSAISAVYSAIWNEWLPASGKRVADAPCIERHMPTFDPQTGTGGVEIWIPLQA